MISPTKSSFRGFVVRLLNNIHGVVLSIWLRTGRDLMPYEGPVYIVQLSDLMEWYIVSHPNENRLSVLGVLNPKATQYLYSPGLGAVQVSIAGQEMVVVRGVDKLTCRDGGLDWYYKKGLHLGEGRLAAVIDTLTLNKLGLQRLPFPSTMLAPKEERGMMKLRGGKLQVGSFTLHLN